MEWNHLFKLTYFAFQEKNFGKILLRYSCLNMLGLNAVNVGVINYILELKH